MAIVSIVYEQASYLVQILYTIYNYYVLDRELPGFLS